MNVCIVAKYLVVFNVHSFVLRRFYQDVIVRSPTFEVYAVIKSNSRINFLLSAKSNIVKNYTLLYNNLSFHPPGYSGKPSVKEITVSIQQMSYHII